MEGPKKMMYDKSGAKLVQALEKRNMEGYYCPTARTCGRATRTS